MAAQFAVHLGRGELRSFSQLLSKEFETFACGLETTLSCGFLGNGPDLGAIFKYLKARIVGGEPASVSAFDAKKKNYGENDCQEIRGNRLGSTSLLLHRLK